jgi:hypothetical protein
VKQHKDMLDSFLRHGLNRDEAATASLLLVFVISFPPLPSFPMF